MTKNNKNKQLVINMAANLLSTVVGFCVSFFLTPFIIERVGVEANGFVSLAGNFIGYATIVTMALNSMAGRFITISIHQEDYDETNKYMSSVFAANLLSSAVLTVPAVLLIINMNSWFNVSAAIVSDVKILWAFLFANFLYGNIVSVFGVATFSQNRLDIQSGTGIILSLVRAGIIVAAYMLFDTKVWYIGATTFLCTLLTSVVNIYCTKHFLPFAKISRKYFDFKKIKDLLSAGVWNSVSKVSNILSEGLDLLVANLFIGDTAMGIISLAKHMPAYILSFTGGISSIFAPQLTINYAKNNMEEIKNDLISSIKILGFITCIPLSIMYAYGDVFFGLWAPTQDAKLLQTIAIVASLEFPLVLPLEPLWNIFTTTNKVKQSSLYLVINSAATIIIEFILLHFATAEYQKIMIIVGVSTAFSIVRALTFLPLYGAKCLNFKKTIFYKPAFQNLLAVIVLTGISLFVKKIFPLNSWFALIAASCLTAAISFVINYFALLSKHERDILKSKIFRKKAVENDT